VRFLCAAHKREIGSGRNAFMTVGIQADPEQGGLAFGLLGICHGPSFNRNGPRSIYSARAGFQNRHIVMPESARPGRSNDETAKLQ